MEFETYPTYCRSDGRLARQDKKGTTVLASAVHELNSLVLEIKIRDERISLLEKSSRRDHKADALQMKFSENQLDLFEERP